MPHVLAMFHQVESKLPAGELCGRAGSAPLSVEEVKQSRRSRNRPSLSWAHLWHGFKAHESSAEAEIDLESWLGAQAQGEEICAASVKAKAALERLTR